MEFDNSFEVPLPPAEAWKVLLDIERIAPCMPGAELTEVVDENTYKGKIGVRLGPVALDLRRRRQVRGDRRCQLTRRACRRRAPTPRAAAAPMPPRVFRLEPAGSGSKVLVHTNLTLSGAVAQYGRGVGIIQATAAQLMNQFAKCLKDKLAQERRPRRRRACVRCAAGAALAFDRSDQYRCRRRAAQADFRLCADGEGDLELRSPVCSGERAT